jgi:tRNA(fMet)-specific endonuclease VapC
MAKKELIILDTDILIEIIRKNITVIQKCDHMGTEKLAISSISFNEFLAGSLDKEDLQRNIKFLKRFKLVSINRNIDRRSERSRTITELYKTYAISHRPGIPDMLIAANSLYFGHSVYTNNKKHFRFIPGIRLV